MEEQKTYWVRNTRTNLVWETTAEQAKTLLRETDDDGPVYEQAEKPEAPKKSTRKKADSTGDTDGDGESGEG